jgi:AcrR family transcriptional regulator
MATPALLPQPTRKAAATAERILQAAILGFAEHGYMGARIDGIAKRAEGNMRMLYHHYGNKETLYVRILSGENLAGARHLHRSSVQPALSAPLLHAIDAVLRRGEAWCTPRRDHAWAMLMAYLLPPAP